MDERSERTKPYQVILSVAGVVIIVAGLRSAASIVVPFLLSAFLAILCGPPLAWLGRRGVPRGMALVVVLVVVAAVVVGLATFVVGTVNHFVAVWPSVYHPRVVDLRDDWNQWIDSHKERFPQVKGLNVGDGSQLWSQVAPDDLTSHFTSALRR